MVFQGVGAMDQKIRCANRSCRRLFLPNPRVKNHQFCDREGCQRVRRNRWQQQKMKDDPEYQEDQKESQQCWVEQNHDYWRKYRDMINDNFNFPSATIRIPVS